jgi:hypothetical protein
MDSPSSSMSPSMRTPSMRSLRRLTERSSVDLPQPEGPMSAVTLPRGTSMATEKSARAAPYQSEKSDTAMTTCSWRTAACTSEGTSRPCSMASRMAEARASARGAGGSPASSGGNMLGTSGGRVGFGRGVVSFVAIRTSP